MSIKFKVISEQHPGAPEGAPRYFASAVNDQPVRMARIKKDIAKISSIDERKVETVLNYLIELIPFYLEQGKKVNLEELGDFVLYLDSLPSETEDEVSFRNIAGYRVVFEPGQEFKAALETFSFEKMEEDHPNTPYNLPHKKRDIGTIKKS